jgi:predicted TIM-barrel fold metal-dependent hydrolase
MIVDAWMQHPTRRFLDNDMFASLRRWSGSEIPEGELPIEATVAAMDGAGVGFGLLTAWHAPREGALISNEEVAEWVRAHPDRFAGLAAVPLDRPMDAVRELRRCVGELGMIGLPRSGRRKVLFGSNYPMIFPGHALDGLQELGLDEEAERCYLHENTRRVFGLAAPAP